MVFGFIEKGGTVETEKFPSDKASLRKPVLSATEVFYLWSIIGGVHTATAYTNCRWLRKYRNSHTTGRQAGKGIWCY